MEERFSEDEQNKIVDIIGEVLGREEPAEGEGEEMDAETAPSVENGY